MSAPALGLATLIVLAAPGAARAVEPVNTGTFGRTAIRGYDPIAYFEEGEPVRGSKKHTVEWMGATWRFASVERRDRFAESPERWAPQYGGYCAYAVSRGYTAPTDPDAWAIVDGKLYLNYSLEVRDLWREDVPGNIERADANWPQLLEE
ncbi:MAG: YHS domain-containing (seleno)protein [Thermoanaerobaculia bacterium]|nr:YHS domain-containing (seleno)protein [Thermoanaerobaculia bacterium]